MMKNNIKKILLCIAVVTVILSVFTVTAFAWLAPLLSFTGVKLYFNL